MSDRTTIRRRNTLALFQAHAEQALAGGEPPKGLEQAFASRLQISPSMWSQIKASRPIGDKLARQIETLTGQPAGWLDVEHEDADAAAKPTAAEAAFLALALSAYRSTDAAGRRELRRWLKRLVG
ncbi:MAG: hypothetical protein QM674_12160 [Burkholderiaceae bacterium]